MSNQFWKVRERILAQPIKHYILTRFNVASPGREQAIRLRPGWLAGRFELFEKYCLPSVASQTIKEFEWIIFFDNTTSDHFREKIITLQKVFPFRAEFTHLSDMREIAPQAVRKNHSANWLLTSRLDSDDILAVDHVARLRAIIGPVRSQVINFLEGTILSVNRKGPRLYRIEDHSNPFASLLEPLRPEAKTIWGEKHVDISKMTPVRQIAGRPAWMQIVHGGNVSNRIKGERVAIADYRDAFPHLSMIAETSKESREAIIFENMVASRLRNVRETFRTMAKSMVVSAKGSISK